MAETVKQRIAREYGVRLCGSPLSSLTQQGDGWELQRKIDTGICACERCDCREEVSPGGQSGYIVCRFCRSGRHT
jgi:hypothetical protein